MKKYIILSFLNLLFILSLSAQVPQNFNYQGVATDGGSIVTGSITLQISILEGGPTGALKLRERHFTNTNPQGVFSIPVGAGNEIVTGSWNDIDWSNGEIYVKVEFDPSGGTSFTDMGTTQLLSVPFALYGEDADSDPNNEIQSLTLNGSMLNISDAGSIDISSAFQSSWEGATNIANTNSGNVGIGVTSSQATAKLTIQDDQTSFNEGIIEVENTSTSNSDAIAVSGRSVPSDFYGIGGQFTGGWRGVVGQVTPTGNNTYYGVYGSAMGGNGTNYGVYGTASGTGLAYAGYFSGTVHVTSSLEVLNDIVLQDDLSVMSFSTFGGTSGDRFTIGSNGVATSYGSSSQNVYIGWPSISNTNYPNNGFVAVTDPSSNNQAGLFVNASGDGVMFADVKNFRTDHPTDQSKEIWYACVEGPEVAAYTRGTTTLVHGEAMVTFPEHFQLISNVETMTISLTPLSADAKGLAVIEKTESGFKIKELMSGVGNYSFDWEVKCVRKGYEDFKVVRNKLDLQIPRDHLNEGEEDNSVKENVKHDKN